VAALHPPSSKATVNVSDERVDRYLTLGWTKVAQPKPKPAPESETVAERKPAKKSTAKRTAKK